MNCKNKSLSLDLTSNQFVARYTTNLGKVVVKTFNTQDPETIYNITAFWRSIDNLEKQHCNNLQQNKLNELDSKVSN